MREEEGLLPSCYFACRCNTKRQRPARNARTSNARRMLKAFHGPQRVILHETAVAALLLVKDSCTLN